MVFASTKPYFAVSQMLTSGPMALLKGASLVIRQFSHKNIFFLNFFIHILCVTEIFVALLPNHINPFNTKASECQDKILYLCFSLPLQNPKAQNSTRSVNINISTAL